MTSTLDYGPADALLRFTPGDDLIIRVNMAVDVTGRAYSAGIMEKGVEVRALTCKITDAATGLIDVSLSDTLSAALTGCGLKWYFTETISGVTKTLLQERVSLAERG